MGDSLPKQPKVRVPLVRAPVVPVALAMMCGIVTGRLGSLGTAAWAVWAGAGLVAAVVCLARGWRRLAVTAALLTVFALTAVHVRLSYFRLPEDHIVTYAGPARMPATIRGRIASAPSILRQGEPMDYPREPATNFDLEASGILTDGGWRPASGLAAVSVLEEAPRLRQGQEVKLVGSLSRVHSADNPGQRDPWAEGRRTGRLAAFRVPAADGATVLADASGGWLRRVRDRAASWAGDRLRQWASGRGGLLLEALILGRRDPALADLQDVMARAGIAHLLSISGMHLGMFLGFVYLACRLATLGPRRSALVALLCLSGYLLLAEARSPLMRSAVMAAVLCAGVILGRRHMALNALAVAAVLLLAADPMDLFSPGFQLSFGIVAGLVVLMEPFRELLFGRWIRVRGLMVFRGEERVRRWLYHKAADWAMNAAAMSLLAWLLSAPLLAVHFRLFSPYGAPLTLLAAPLVVAAIVPGYLALAVGSAAPNLAAALAGLGGRVAGALAAATDACAGLPGLGFDVQPMGPGWAAACYVAIVLFVLHRRIHWGRVWVAGAVAVVVLLTVAAQRPAPAPDRAELNVLAVGGGQCAVLRTPEGATYVLDAGSLGRESCGEQILVPFLLHLRLPHPRAAFLSHANSDHYNALPALISRGWLDRAYLTDCFRADPNGGLPSTAGRLLGMLREGRTEVVHLAAPRTIRLDERTQVEVLWPPAGRRDLEVNDTSLVLRITCDGRSALVPGDAGQVAQTALAAANDGRLRSDVLVLPHHGGWKPTLPDFLRAVGPEVVVASAAREPAAPASGGEAARRFYERLAGDCRRYSTPRHGWIQVRFGRDGVEVRTMRR